MNFRKFQLAAVAIALGTAMGAASAEGGGIGSASTSSGTSVLGAGSSSVATTPAAGKAAVGVQGNAALTSETAVTGNAIEGSPGTQSGPSVTEMGAGPSAMSPGYDTARLSRTQMRLLQRYSALR